MKTKTFQIVLGTPATPWFRVNSKVANFIASILLTKSPDFDGTVTYQVASSDKSNDVINPTITRSATTATISDSFPAGGLVQSVLKSLPSGTGIVVSGAGAPFDGAFDVTNTTGVITYTVANSGATQSNPGTTLQIMRTATAAALTAGTPVLLNTPFNYIRALLAGGTLGQAAITINQGEDN